MALTVRTNNVALRAMHDLNATQSKLGGTLERVSSGMRVNRAADDAAGLGVATNLRTHISSTRQAMRNANDGISVVQTAEGAAGSVIDILDRMRELAVQSSSETLADDERAYIQDEFTQLTAEVDRIANVTEFNGVQLADGSTATLDVQVGIQNNADSRITITLGDLSAATLGVDALSVDMSTSAGGQSAIDAIDTALDTVNAYRSDLGAVQNRIDNALTNAATYVENLSAAEGAIMDADYAFETAEMTKQQIMQQSGIASMAQAKGIAQSVTSLLQ
jgi:flagellin